MLQLRIRETETQMKCIRKKEEKEEKTLNN